MTAEQKFENADGDTDRLLSPKIIALISAGVAVIAIALIIAAVLFVKGQKDNPATESGEEGNKEIAQNDTKETESNGETEMTLEQYVKNNKDALNSINKTADEAGMDVSFEGNTVVYSYDIAQIDGVTEELAMSGEMSESLMEAMAENEHTFRDLRSKLGAETGIRDAIIRVIYKYEDYNILIKDFTP